MGFQIEYGVLKLCTEEPGVTEVTIPDSVIRMEPYAFDACENLTQINVSESNLRYCSMDGVLYTKDGSVLLRCPAGRTRLTIPDGVTEIHEYAFAGCHNLTQLTIPDSVTKIGSFMFPHFYDYGDRRDDFGQSRWTQITVSGNNPCFCSIDGVLYNKDVSVLLRCPPAKEHITIPDSVKVIADYAFAECFYLKAVTVPAGVTTIGNGAFSVSALEEIIIPDSVTEIGDAAFQECIRLKRLVIGSGLQMTGEFLCKDCRSLTRVVLPDSLTNIGFSAFDGCDALREIRIPARTEKIQKFIFFGAPLEEIVIPEGVKEIGAGAFDAAYLRVIRLRPDDPAFYRAYGEIPALQSDVDDGFAEHMEKILNILRTGDYASEECEETLKYVMLMLHYLHHPDDEKLFAYIQDNIDSFLHHAVSNGDEAFIQALMQADILIPAESTDRYIQQALDRKQQKIWAYLADYKHRRFGIAPEHDSLL